MRPILAPGTASTEQDVTEIAFTRTSPPAMNRTSHVLSLNPMPLHVVPATSSAVAGGSGLDEHATRMPADRSIAPNVVREPALL